MISPGLFIPAVPDEFRMTRSSAPSMFESASPEFCACLAAGVEMRSRTERKGDTVTFIIETVPKCAVVDLGDGRKRVYTKYEQPPAH